MLVCIEFLGISRLITGKKDETVDLTEGASFRDLVRRLAGLYPNLVGNVIQPGKDALQVPNVFHLKGGCLIKEDGLDQNLNPDDRVVLMSLSAGG